MIATHDTETAMSLLKNIYANSAAAFESFFYLLPVLGAIKS